MLRPSVPVGRGTLGSATWADHLPRGDWWRAYGDPVLKARAKDIPADFPAEELQKLVADMYDTMYYAHGVGLAAPHLVRSMVRVGHARSIWLASASASSCTRRTPQA